MRESFLAVVAVCVLLPTATGWAGSQPELAEHAMVVSQSHLASQVGVAALEEGGTAVDAAVATAFALAVTHPVAGNIGGGGFLVYRTANGEAVAYDFRERAPAAATATMWLDEQGGYVPDRHHQSHLAVGVPGTVAGLYLAWQENGNLPWKRLVEPAVKLAAEGFTVSHELARSLDAERSRFKRYPASWRQFTNQGESYNVGDTLRQSDLAATLARIAEQGPAGFYEGQTAELIVQEMQRGGGILTREDLENYQPRRRQPLRGSYRGYEILSMPPPSSGGIALLEMLNILEARDLGETGYAAADTIHWYAEAMRRAYADRAMYVGDPEFNPQMPVERLISKDHAARLQQTIEADRASKSSPTELPWSYESAETTHLSVVDANRNAVALTYTLEYGYGSAIVVEGGGFLLNNEMGDFNPVPGLSTEGGLIGTPPNLTAPGKRMLSSMTPSIVTKNGRLVMVTGSPGGRTIINTVLQTIVNVVDFGMNAQEAVDAGRVHHQWLPDRILYEPYSISSDARATLRAMGHKLVENPRQGAAQVIVVREDGMLEGATDRRVPDGGAVGY